MQLKTPGLSLGLLSSEKKRKKMYQSCGAVQLISAEAAYVS